MHKHNILLQRHSGHYFRIKLSGTCDAQLRYIHLVLNMANL
jgi:hypothetical protein